MYSLRGSYKRKHANIQELHDNTNTYIQAAGKVVQTRRLDEKTIPTRRMGFDWFLLKLIKVDPFQFLIL
jgi:hypothetical protein